MPNRREFLRRATGAAGGVVFAGCCLLDSARAQTKRRVAMVGGRRAKTIDVHAHIRITEVWGLVKNTDNGKGLERLLSIPDPKLDAHSVDARLADMDKAGVDVQAVSIAQFG